MVLVAGEEVEENLGTYPRRQAGNDSRPGVATRESHVGVAMEEEKAETDRVRVGRPEGSTLYIRAKQVQIN